MISRLHAGFQAPMAARPGKIATPAVSRREADTVQFGALKGSEEFVLTVDFPQSLQEKLAALMQVYGEEESQIIGRGIRVLAEWQQKQQKYARTQLAMLRRVQEKRAWGLLGSKISYEFIGVSHRAPRPKTGEATVAKEYKLNAEALVSLRRLAQGQGRTMEQLVQDAVEVMYDSGRLRKQLQKDGYKFGIVCFWSDGPIRDVFVWD